MKRPAICRTRRIAHVLCAALCVGAALVAGAQATDSAQEPSDLVFRANTRMVLLDLVLVDRNGRPIRNVEKNELTVFERGKPQSIAFFESRTATAAQSRAPAPLLQPHVTTNRPDVIQAGGSAILLLDGLNTPPDKQIFVKQQM